MANIPGSPYVLPGVYGPTSVEIVKTDKGYAIGWAPMKMWGGPFIEGAPKEIARDLITRLNKTNSEYNNTFYGCIYIKFKPEFECTISDKLSSPFQVNVEFWLAFQ